MNLAERFPPLYQCEKCGKAVKVTNQGQGVDPIIKRKCSCPEDTPILARRKVTLRGKGQLSHIKTMQIKVKLTLRQFLSYATGRSI